MLLVYPLSARCRHSRASGNVDPHSKRNICCSLQNTLTGVRQPNIARGVLLQRNAHTANSSSDTQAPSLCSRPRYFLAFTRPTANRSSCGGAASP